VDGGGVGRVLDVVPHLVVVRQQDEVGVPLSHHSYLQQTDRLTFWIEFQNRKPQRLQVQNDLFS